MPSLAFFGDRIKLIINKPAVMLI